MVNSVVNALLWSGFAGSVVHGFDLDPTNSDQIKSFSASLAHGMVSMYNGNQSGQVPGLLPSPYYWWSGGAMFASLIDYWHFTGDDTYNDLVSQGLLFQVGQNDDYSPSNQSASLGNDDQSMWALAAMSAAEYGLPEPSGSLSWLSLATNVWNEQAARWDTATCNGGLRWQIFSFNNGYNYKNSISTGMFYQLSARLARFTGNTTYSDWAGTSYDWIVDTKLMNDNFDIFDGAHTTENCTDVNKIQWTYVAGTFLTGAAHMYNVTGGDATWKSALDGLWNTTASVFFPKQIMTEVACEASNSCNVDATFMKGLLSQWLLDTMTLAPYTAGTIQPLLQASAVGAASACGDGSSCGLSWSAAGNSTAAPGIGLQMSALSVVQALLGQSVSAPGISNSTSSTSPSSTGSSTPSGTSNSSVTSSHPSGTSTGVPTTKPNAAARIGNVIPSVLFVTGLLGMVFAL